MLLCTIWAGDATVWTAGGHMAIRTALLARRDVEVFFDGARGPAYEESVPIFK